MKKNNIIILLTVIALMLVACGLILVACGQQTSVSNPAPVGESRNVGGHVSLTVLDVILPADDMISEPIKYTETPQPNSEYAIIKLRIQCSKLADISCRFSSFFIDIADQDGSIMMKSQDEYIHSSQLVKASIPDELGWSMVGLSPGSTLEGNVVLLVSKYINYTMITYTELYGSPSYFAMP